MPLTPQRESVWVYPRPQKAEAVRAESALSTAMRSFNRLAVARRLSCIASLFAAERPMSSSPTVE